MPGYELIGSEELAQLKDIFDSGGVLFRQGFDNIRKNCFKVKAFEDEFSKKFLVKHSLAVSSGTAALRVALASLDIKEGDEIITQSFTFVATVEAIIESKATPVCANIDKTLNIDPEDLIKCITPKTKAVIVVHMLGTPARLQEISKICKKYNLYLIEDTAWGCGGTLNNKLLGTWGDIGTYSFDFAKTITTGEGGMLTFNDSKKYKKASAWHDHGHENNPNYPRWEDTRSSSGFNFRMTEMQGAIGIAQLKKLSFILDQQRKNKMQIWHNIKDFEFIEKRHEPLGSEDTADALIFFVKDNLHAKNCRQELLKLGISTKILPEAYTWHFAGVWSHMPELMKAHKGRLSESLKKSHQILTRAVSIPINVFMDKNIPEKIRSALKSSLK